MLATVSFSGYRLRISQRKRGEQAQPKAHRDAVAQTELRKCAAQGGNAG